jgi:hypothetical protein
MSTDIVRPALQGIGAALTLAGTAAGAWFGFEFGLRAGGALVGVIAALNCAVMSGLLADGLIERVRRLTPRRSR